MMLSGNTGLLTWFGGERTALQSLSPFLKFNQMNKENVYRELIAASILFVILLVWTYFTAEVTIEGVPLPRHEAGMWGVIMWLVIFALAVGGAYLLHGIVTLISRIKWRKKKTQ